MAYRKNIKRTDPRYFLHETAAREETSAAVVEPDVLVENDLVTEAQAGERDWTRAGQFGGTLTAATKKRIGLFPDVTDTKKLGAHLGVLADELKLSLLDNLSHFLGPAPEMKSARELQGVLQLLFNRLATLSDELQKERMFSTAEE